MSDYDRLSHIIVSIWFIKSKCHTENCFYRTFKNFSLKTSDKIPRYCPESGLALIKFAQVVLPLAFLAEQQLSSFKSDNVILDFILKFYYMYFDTTENIAYIFYTGSQVCSSGITTCVFTKDKTCTENKEFR